MRIITKDLTDELGNISSSNYLLDKNYLIFDIETTGFSRQYDIIYMVGCILKTDDQYTYYNIFAETPEQEPEVINYFFNLLINAQCVIHFNGNRFDIPFLLARANKYHIKDQISQLVSVDIYDCLRPFRKSLDLPNLKLDTIQAELGYTRKDLSTGGDLIPIYHLYAKTPYEPYYELLSLHNKEDVEGMINLLPIIDITMLIDGVIDEGKIDLMKIRQDSHEITALYELAEKASMNFHLQLPCHSQMIFKAYSRQATLHMPILAEEKRFFFSNYKDYMYLTHKDEVMHKSVANFIPKDLKRRAKKSECYTSHFGLFISLFFDGSEKPEGIKLFKDDLRAKEQFVMVTPKLEDSFYQQQAQGFLRQAKGIK